MSPKRRIAAVQAVVLAASVLAGCGGARPEPMPEAVTADRVRPQDPRSPVTPPPRAAVEPGQVAEPYPTIRFVTLEWPFGGDANQNASVAVRYRVQGTAAWRDAMPLRRVEPGSNAGFAWLRRFSGSLFDLEPDTAYDVELAMRDPDGGETTRTLETRTRAVPVPMRDAPVRAATPASFAAVLRGARPGDVIELARGTYGWPDWRGDGVPGRPIVIRSVGGAVFRGELSLIGRRYVHLDGLEVDGRIRFNGAVGIAIVRCTVRASADHAGDGIVAYTRAQDAYIADNVVTGITPWVASSLGVNGRNLGEGIVVTGPGHVIEHNRVRGFRDGVSLMEEGEAVDQHSIDIIGNDVSEAADDGIEADFCRHNCRIVRNRLTNTFVAMSAQPSLGGPTWFVRNLVYNVAHVPFKLYRGSIGDVLLHNTVVKGGDAFGMSPGRPVSRLLTRNNVFIGGPGGTWNGYGNGRGDVAALADVAPDASLDHDAFGSTAIGFRGVIGTERFVGLEEMQAATSERRALQVDLSVFAAPVTIPSAAMTAHEPPDLRPRPGSAIDGRALAIPNINERADGRRPSLGAYDAGDPPRRYGPR
jgi:hypothetical protein